MLRSFSIFLRFSRLRSTKIEKNSAVELHQTQSGVLKKKRQQNVFFVHAGRALRLVQDTFRHLFSVIKGPINKFSR